MPNLETLANPAFSDGDYKFHCTVISVIKNEMNQKFHFQSNSVSFHISFHISQPPPLSLSNQIITRYNFFLLQNVSDMKHNYGYIWWFFNERWHFFISINYHLPNINDLSDALSRIQQNWKGNVYLMRF